jgi:2-polyprenyl-3-methyl-5-hydroxy-6-metoxy-1,4-benzoquinol methylase
MTGIADPGYFLNQRLDVAALVPATARAILDVGCGAGRLGQHLKETLPGCRVTGIEQEGAMADLARSVLDEVLVANLETLDRPFPPETFDCIICADILEHLVHPEEVLRRFRPMLHHGGSLVCSIPNVRHYSALLRLLTRGWVYEEYGVFDKTHLRFFSLRGMRNMIQEAGYTIDLVRPRVVASRKARLLTAPFRRHVEEFLAFQYLIRAIPQ